LTLHTAIDYCLVFYDRAWGDRHRLLSSATTHTLADVIWSLGFR
jgi:hypothetical protein